MFYFTAATVKQTKNSYFKTVLVPSLKVTVL